MTLSSDYRKNDTTRSNNYINIENINTNEKQFFITIFKNVITVFVVCYFSMIIGYFFNRAGSECLK